MDFFKVYNRIVVLLHLLSCTVYLLSNYFGPAHAVDTRDISVRQSPVLRTLPFWWGGADNKPKDGQNNR